MKCKYPVLGLFLLLFAVCKEASAQQGYNSLYQYFEADSTAMPGYSGVKVQTTQTNSSRKRTNSSVSTTESLYDPSGKLVEEEQTSSISSATLRTEFSYDSTGKINYIVRTGGKSKVEAFAQYDEQGRLSEIVYCEEGNPCQTRHYAYEEDNTEYLYSSRQVLSFGAGDKKKSEKPSGTAAWDKERYELVRERFYDPEGRLEESRVYASDTFSVGWKFEYDAAGRKSKVWAFNSTDQKLANDYEYDKNGRLITENTYVWVTGNKLIPYRESEPGARHYEYDGKNRLIRTEMSGDNYDYVQEFTYYKY